MSEQPKFASYTLTDGIKIVVQMGVHLHVRTGVKTDLRKLMTPTDWFDYRIEMMSYDAKTDEMVFLVGHHGDSMVTRGETAVALAKYVLGPVLKKAQAETLFIENGKSVQQSIDRFLLLDNEKFDVAQDRLLKQMEQSANEEGRQGVKKLLRRIAALAKALANTSVDLFRHLRLILGVAPDLAIRQLAKTNWTYFMSVRKMLFVVEDLRFRITDLSEMESSARDAMQLLIEKYSSQLNSTEELQNQLYGRIERMHEIIKQFAFSEEFLSFENAMLAEVEKAMKL